MSNWRDQYDDAADKEYGRYKRMPIAALLEEAESGATAGYYTLWRVIGERATAAQAGTTLFNFLLGEHPMLDRYHCASALLGLLKCTEFTPTQLSAPPARIQNELARLRSLVAQAVSPSAK